MLIKKFELFNAQNKENLLKNNNFSKKNKLFPLIRHFSSYESAISIIKNNYLLSRKELKKNIDYLDENIIINKNLRINNKWWRERKNAEYEKFNSEDIIYCTVDWFNDSGYETGHGPVMIYFDENIFENFKVTMTLLDTLHENNLKIYNKDSISKIYSQIINNSEPEYNNEATKILENLNHKNENRIFNTSKGRIHIPERFYDKYAEIQIHTNKISTDYIKEIRFTDNYFTESDNDNENKNKLINLCNNKKIKISI